MYYQSLSQVDKSLKKIYLWRYTANSSRNWHYVPTTAIPENRHWPFSFANRHRANAQQLQVNDGQMTRALVVQSQ
jgi:hypothetical protein